MDVEDLEGVYLEDRDLTFGGLDGNIS